MIKVLIVGCGKIAGIADKGEGAAITHASGYRMTPGTLLVGCVDTSFEQAQKFGDLHQCKPYRTVMEALKEIRPEIVSICTPDNKHYIIAKELLDSEYPPEIIFLEKPACQSQFELDELLNLSQRRGVEIVVNHTRRFDPKHRALKKCIEREEFGQFYRANVIYYGGWQHNGVHAIDTLSFLLSDSLKVLYVKNSEASHYEGDPTLEMELEFRHHAGRVLLSGVDEDIFQIFDFDLWFTKVRLRIEDFGSHVRIERKAVNSIGENILVPDDTTLSVVSETPMQMATKIMVDYLSSKESSLLAGYRISDTADTYKTLWDGTQAYGQMKQKNHC